MQAHSLFSKAFACMISLGVAVYGGVGLWQSWAGPEVIDSKSCGVWLCPGEFSDQRVYDLQEQGTGSRFDKALPEFERALVREPASAYRWADLGEAMQRANRFENAHYCFRRALARAPHSPAILFRAANFYFGANDKTDAFRSLATILGNADASAYYVPAFVTYSRMDVPVSRVLDNGIPRSPSAAQGFLRFLIEEGQVADVEAAWKWMEERSLSDEITTAEYLNFLLGKKQNEHAAENWQQLNRNAAAEYRRSDWVFNGGFEFRPGPSPFDWHLEPAEDVRASRTCFAVGKGQCSLELTFRGTENIDYHGVSENAVVRPGKWMLQGSIKSEGITTDQGVSLRIYDAIQPQNLDVRTDSLTGTHEWRKMECLFKVKSATSLVRIEVTRQASLKADNKIVGRVWIDSVSLKPVDN